MKRMVTEEQLNKIDGETPESLEFADNVLILKQKNGKALTTDIATGSSKLYKHDVYFVCGMAGGSTPFSDAACGYVFYSTSEKSVSGDFISKYCPTYWSFVSSTTNSNKYYTVYLDKSSGSTKATIYESTVADDGSVTTVKVTPLFVGDILRDKVTPL